MARPPSPMTLVMRHHMALDVGHAVVTATVYDEQLSETFNFKEYYNLSHERVPAVRRAVERAANKAVEIEKRNK